VLVDLGAGPVGQAVTLVVAQNPAPEDQGPEFGKASPVGLVVVLLLLIATVFLVRSMTKHLRRVPESFDAPAAPPVPTEARATADPDADGAEGRAEVEAPPER